MRFITFTIPGEPSVQVEAREQPDGTILFNLTVGGDGNATGDLRGLFFDVNDPDLENNLVMEGEDITNQDYGDVSNLGNGVNMYGNGGAPYDAGVSFGLSGRGNGRSDISATSFVLSTLDGSPLTLDSIANVDFGARVNSVGEHSGARSGGPKLVTIAPAAPDAIDDLDLMAVEDTTVVFDVLANDTDADGDTLTIIDVTAPEHGTVEIIDNMLVYTPDENYGGGSDTFEYSLSDNNGGGDSATVELFVEAVADAPALSVETSAGANVNEIVLTITSALVDTDGSETYELSIDTDMLPTGATLSRTQILNPGAVETVILTLLPNTSASFELAVNAISTEGSNLDQAVATVATAIDVVFTENDFDVDFQAVGQSQWNSGEGFSFEDDRFIGLDIDDSFSSIPFFDDSSSVDIDFRVGLQSTFEIEGGSIDATIPWDISVDTTYNTTTDTLLISPDAVLASGGSFTTFGPSATYVLDFIFEAAIGANLDFLEFDVFTDSSIINVRERFNLIDYDSATSDPFELGLGPFLSLLLQWPTIDVEGSETSLGVYAGNDASNNFLELRLDVDDLLTTLAGLPQNPVDFEIDFSVVGLGFQAALEVFDLDLIGGLNFLQSFIMTAGDLSANLIFEDGSTQVFNLDDDLVINNASILDVDGDGEIEFDIAFSLNDTIVTNDTDLNFNIGYEGGFLSGSYEYDIVVDSDEGEFGPLIEFGDSLDVADVDIIAPSFELEFESETVEFSVVSPNSATLDAAGLFDDQIIVARELDDKSQTVSNDDVVQLTTDDALSAFMQAQAPIVAEALEDDTGLSSSIFDLAIDDAHIML